MKSAEQIFKEANKSPRIYGGHKAMDNDAYNTGYMLSHEQIQAASLLKISAQQNMSIEESAKQHYIDGISVDGIDFSKVDKSLLNAFFGETIDKAVTTSQTSGKPAFLSIDSDKHFVMIALVPNKDTGKLSVLYLNSITERNINHDVVKEEFIDTLRQKEFGLKEKDIQSLKTEFIDKIDNVSAGEFQILQKRFAKNLKQLSPNSLELELLQAQFINLQENIEHTKKLSKVGKDFANVLVDNLKSKGIPLEHDKVIDKSQDQQLSNCCGLSVASNISNVAEHIASNKALNTVDSSLFNPKNAKQKESYYKDFGKKFFADLDDVIMQHASDPEPYKKAVERYCLSEKNPELQKQFANERLDEFLKQQKSTNLNDKMVNKMQKAVIAIISPICNNEQEKNSLKKNAAKLVRQCAANIGKKMSWSQGWERFKDKVSNIVGSLINRGGRVKAIIDQHPRLKQTLENNLKNNTSTKINSAASGKNNKPKRGR